MSGNFQRLLIEVFNASWGDRCNFPTGNHELQGFAFLPEQRCESYYTLGQRKQAKLRLHDDSQSPFTPDEPVDRIVRKRIPDSVFLEVRSAEFDQLSTRHNYLERTHVLSGRAVFESARSRSVARDRTTDGRLFLTRGIWCEQQPGCCHRFLYVSDDCAWTDPDCPGFDVELADLIQRSKGEQHSIVRDRCARGAGLRAGGCHGNPLGGGLFHELDHVVDRLRPRYQVRNQLKTG